MVKRALLERGFVEEEEEAEGASNAGPHIQYFLSTMLKSDLGLNKLNHKVTQPSSEKSTVLPCPPRG